MYHDELMGMAQNLLPMNITGNTSVTALPTMISAYLHIRSVKGAGRITSSHPSGIQSIPVI